MKTDLRLETGLAATKLGERQDVAVLGRGLVLGPGSSAPPEWTAAERVVVSQRTLSNPKKTALRLRRLWLTRQPVVIQLGVPLSRLREPETWEVECYQLEPLTTPWRDILFHFTYGNNYVIGDSGQLIWPWTAPATRAGAGAAPPGVLGDVLLPTGTAVWIDGGPRESMPATAEGLPVVSWEDVENSEGLSWARSGVTHGWGKPEGGTAVPLAADLATDQARAVYHVAGPARVIAPAGSGKTRVLTTRLRSLMQERGYSRNNVIALAYNKRAQEEMEQRCTDFSPRIRTLHSLGLEIVRELRGPVRTIDETEVRVILDSLVAPGDFQVGTDRLRPYVDALSAVRHRLSDPTLVEKQSPEIRDFPRVFKEFRERLHSQGLVDFDEQIYAALEGLLKDGRLRRRAQQRCRHLLVDEFQDLNPAQLLMVRLLSVPLFDVFAVGDDDQVLYDFDGASPEFLVDFDRYFPDPISYQLEVNYRCPPQIVAAAASLLGHNTFRLSKEVRAYEPGVTASRSREPTDGQLIVTTSPQGMLEALVLRIAAWRQAGVSPADIAILSRVNALLLAPQIALVEASIPVDSTLGPWLLDRSIVRVALAYTRLALEPESMSPADLELVYRRPYRGIRREFVQHLQTRRVWRMRDIQMFATRAAAGPKIDDLVADLKLLRKRAGKGAGAAFACLRVEIGLSKLADTLDRGKVGVIEAHADELMALEQVGALHPDLATFETWLRHGLSTGRTEGGVTLATVHKVKGQEWDYVAVYGVSDGLLPHRLCMEDVEAERRVFHVAITRARKQVVLFPDELAPSRFLPELLGRTREVKQAGSTIGRGGRKEASGLPRNRRRADGLSPGIGDMVRSGGHEGLVVASGERGITIRVGTAELLVRWGDPITVSGTAGYLTGP